MSESDQNAASIGAEKLAIGTRVALPKNATDSMGKPISGEGVITQLIKKGNSPRAAWVRPYNHSQMEMLLEVHELKRRA
jgi:hypothetical protein